MAIRYVLRATVIIYVTVLGLQAARDIVNNITQYCIGGADAEDIQDVLEDFMDEEFDTICEDESPKGKH